MAWGVRRQFQQGLASPFFQITDGASNFIAIDVGHGNVHENQIGLEGSKGCDGRLSIIYKIQINI
jgi:hypothetical protein